MQIIIYCNSQGKEPYTEWLNQLNDAAGKRFIRAALRKLTLGNTSPLKRLKGDERLWEIRIMNQGPGYRVYCLREQETLIILLGAGTKKTQTQDIRKAGFEADDYYRRFKNRQSLD